MISAKVGYEESLNDIKGMFTRASNRGKVHSSIEGIPKRSGRDEKPQLGGSQEAWNVAMKKRLLD